MEDNFVIVGLKENELELELELGLSIGGSFKRVEKLKPIKKDPARNRTSDLDLREKSQALVVEQESTPVNPQRKREIQAMRRQEAMKKREEKQQKRGLSRGQKAEFRCKENDRETQDSERKKKKVEFSGSLAGETENANQNSSRSQNPSHSVGLNPPMCSVIPVRVPCSCPYQQVQYGFVYPCGTAPPCWGGGGSGNERNVGEQAVNQGLRPFHGCQNPASGFESDPNSTKDERNWKSGSTGSPMCSSSVVSDLQSSSNQGGCSSDIGTHSINSCQPEHPQMNRSSSASNQKGQLEESAQSIDSPTIKVNAGVSGPSQSMGLGPTVEGEPGCCNDKPSVAPANSATAMEERNVEWTTGKRPGNYPASSNGNGNATLPLPLPYMPCVSATGDGPNGKTVNGFLYRYTQAEVSIVCVCHGSLLSPAEFVQHAGVTDVSHPLRHITVIPSAF